jgi:hypothetical protein
MMVDALNAVAEPRRLISERLSRLNGAAPPAAYRRVRPSRRRWQEMAAMTDRTDSLEALEPFVGEWRMVVSFKDMPTADVGARTSFNWLPGKQFLIQRWEVPVPEAPDGIAIIGADPERAGNFLQHYFDSRGVARIYQVSFADGVWKLWRDEPDFSPLDFRQRYTGTFSDDGTTIAGAWEISHDGKTWEHDFDLTYYKA